MFKNITQVLVVQTFDSAIHWLNQYPGDKNYGNCVIHSSLLKKQTVAVLTCVCV